MDSSRCFIPCCHLRMHVSDDCNVRSEPKLYSKAVPVVGNRNLVVVAIGVWASGAYARA